MQTGVGDLRAVKIQVFEVLQPGEVGQTGVGDLCPFQVQPDEAFHVLEMFEAFVGDLGAAQVQRIDEVGQCLDRDEMVIADFAIRQVIGHIQTVVVLGNLQDGSAQLLDGGDGVYFRLSRLGGFFGFVLGSRQRAPRDSGQQRA